MTKIEAVKAMYANEKVQFIKTDNGEHITSWRLSMGKDTFDSMKDEQVIELYEMEDN